MAELTCTGYVTVSKPLGINNHAMYYYPYTYANKNGDIFMNNYGTSLSCTVTISEPKVLNLPAYGLRHSDILIKEVDGVLTVKTKAGLTGYFATLDKSYVVKNVKLSSSTLSLGVLTLAFVDTENVVNHPVKEV
jgi:hypothetical protein